MKYISSRFALIICLQLSAISLCWCIYRDIQIEKKYPGDLRNRVVGSRLQMDGLSPYFYHWKPADGLRYYDWDNITTLSISNATATPFLHQLLYPIANLPQRAISRIWLVLEYLAVLIMTVLSLQLAKEKRQKQAVVFISLLFLYSYAWTANVELGQIYIFIALVAMLFYYFITRKPTLPNAALAGICAISLILMRPNAVLFLLPFLFLAGRYTLKYKAVFFISFFMVLLLAFGSRQARFYWSDYRKAMVEHIKLHQDLGPSVERNAPVPTFENWEGWDLAQIKKAAQFPYYMHNGENGNVFVLLNVGLHTKTPVWVLSGLCITFMLLICFLFYKNYRDAQQLSASSVALLGFCLYMASDIFSPIHRANYNASQWIFPLLLSAGTLSTHSKKIYVTGTLVGLVLNSITMPILHMQHTIGEYMIYASVLGLLLTFKPANRK